MCFSPRPRYIDQDVPMYMADVSILAKLFTLRDRAPSCCCLVRQYFSVLTKALREPPYISRLARDPESRFLRESAARSLLPRYPLVCRDVVT